MKSTKRPFVLLILALVICIAVFSIIISKTVLKHNPPVKPDASRQADSREHDRPNIGDSSKQADSLARQRDENPDSQVSSKLESAQLTPSQVAGRVFPAADLKMLVTRLPADQLEMYQRTREEFPEVDWTEIDLTHRAFMSKREQFPLNLDEADRVAYAAWLKEAETMSRALVELRAQNLGLSLGGKENDRVYRLSGFQDGSPSYTYTSNAGSAITTGASFVRWNPGLDPALGDAIHGGEFYVNINDLGTIFENPQFQLPSGGGSRIIVKEIDGVRSTGEHMTHVAGTVAAWGYYSSVPVEGMAPRAWIRSLIDQKTSDITTYAMATPGQLMAVTNPRTGKLQMRSVVGNASLSYDSISTSYSSQTTTYDSLMRDYPYYVHCFSAGNDGRNGYASLNPPWSIAKNAFAIGSVNDATRDAEGLYVSGGNISDFSSRGPAYDGRIKPDFVGQGDYTWSTLDATRTGGMSGTSMSSPNVAGSVTVLMDYVRQRLPQQYLRSATYKALLVNTTDDRGNAGPDYTYGWGLVNVHAAAKIVRQQAENPSQRLIIEDALSPSQTWTETYASDGTKPIRISIAWLDPAGTANATGDRSPRLINDLDVRLVGPGGTVFYPYVMPFVTGQGATAAFSTSLYNALAVPGDNTTDPAEQIFITAPAGGTYTVQVTHKGALKNNQVQDFSVAVSGLSSVFGVTPDDGLSAAGPQGGPFDAESKSYTITNNSSASLSWSVDANPAAAWLTLTPSSGTLAGGASATVTASFNSTADSLAGGTYTTDLSFAAGGATITRLVSLLVRPMTGFAWDTIPSPRYWKSPFSVNIRAVDSTGSTIRSFTGAAALTPIGEGGGEITISPTTTGNFVDGVWSGLVTVNEASSNIFLRATSSGFTGDSNAFVVEAKSIPTVTTWPTASAIAYGQAVGASTLSGGSTSVPGSFSFGNPTSMLQSGTHSVAVVFTPTDTATYGTVDGMVSLVVNKAAPTVSAWPTASSILYGQALSASTLSGGTASTAGSFAFIAPETTPEPGTYNAAVRFTPTDAANYNTVDGSVAVSVTKQTPTITAWPSANGIVFGQALSASTLTGGTASVAGSFSFDAPATTPNAGTYQAAVTFTPADTANYSTVGGSVNVIVAKATPVVTAWPTASDIEYGQVIADSVLSGGSASVPGTFVFSEPGADFTGSDAFTFKVNDGTMDSDPATISITVGEAAAAPAGTTSLPTSINWWTPAEITTQGWWDASDASSITQTAGRVSQWRDKSGSNYHWGQATETLQPTTGTRTIGDLNALDFTNNGMSLSSGPQPGTGNSLVLAVVHADTFGTATGASNRILSFRVDSNTRFGLFNYQGQIGYNQTNAFTPAYQTMTDGTRIFGGYRNGSTLAVGTDGSYTSVSQSASAFTLNAWYMGSYNATTTGTWDGMIAEIVYLHAYDLETRQKIEGYLAWKWGQEASLPADHPYKLVRPLKPGYTAPVADAQSISTSANTPVDITLTGSDAENDPLTYEIVTQPTYGSLSGTAPNVTYTPPSTLDPGLHNVAVIFIPADTDNYQTVTGTVSVSVSGGTTPYGAWATQYPSSDLSDPNADFDGDGVSNFQEYAFGLNPTTPSAGVIRHADGVVTGRGGPAISATKIGDVINFAAVFGRRKNYLSAGLVYQVDFSADLTAWVTSTDTPTVVASDAEVEAVTVPYPSTIDSGHGAEKPKFFRVGVSMP